MFYREDGGDSFDSLPFREQISSDKCMSVDIDSIGQSKVTLREAASSALRLRYDVAKSTELRRILRVVERLEEIMYRSAITQYVTGVGRVLYARTQSAAKRNRHARYRPLTSSMKAYFQAIL